MPDRIKASRLTRPRLARAGFTRTGLARAGLARSRRFGAGGCGAGCFGAGGCGAGFFGAGFLRHSLLRGLKVVENAQAESGENARAEKAKLASYSAKV